MWCSSFPIPSTSPTIPAAKQSLVAVAGKSQRRNPPQNGGENSTRDTPLGHTSPTTLKTNPTFDQRRNNSSVKISISKEQQQSRERLALSGSDVLFALQRATTQKTRKKRRDPQHSRGPIVSEKEGEEEASDYSNVRPLCVKPDWGSRLDELEKRLLEVTDGAAA